MDASKISGYKTGNGKKYTKSGGGKARRKQPEEGENGGGGHGNTKLPYGLANGEGLNTKGMTPKEVWKALEGKGYNPKEVYAGLKKGKGAKEIKENVNAVKYDPVKIKEEYNSLKKDISEGKTQVHTLRAKIRSSESFIKSLRDDLDKLEPLKKKFAGKSREEIAEMKMQAQRDYMNSSDSFESRNARRRFAELSMYQNMDENWTRKTLEEQEKLVSEYRNKIEDTESKMRGKMDSIKDKVNSRFPSYSDCETVEDVEMKANCNGMFRDMCDFKGKKVDANSLKASVGKLDSMMRTYPKLKGKLGAFDFEETGKRTYASSMFRGGVSLNPDYFGDENKLRESLHNDILKGFHPPRVGIESVMVHEYGHQIDDLLSQKSGDFSRKLIKEVKKKLKFKNLEEVCGSVSEYAKTGISSHPEAPYKEFLAEAWSEYLCSDNPREVAVTVGRMVEEEISKL